MVPRRDCYSSSFQTRRYTLAPVLLCILGICTRRLSAQAPGSALVFSDSDVDQILSTHNDLRGSVDPEASNMQALVSEIGNSIASYSISCSNVLE